MKILFKWSGILTVCFMALISIKVQAQSFHQSNEQGIKPLTVNPNSSCPIKILPPDNMLAYVPEIKNPDRMPVFRRDYGKTGYFDNMPNTYLARKKLFILKEKILPLKNESHPLK